MFRIEAINENISSEKYSFFGIERSRNGTRICSSLTTFASKKNVTRIRNA